VLTDSRIAHYEIPFMHFIRLYCFYVIHIQDYSRVLVICLLLIVEQMTITILYDVFNSNIMGYCLVSIVSIR